LEKLEAQELVPVLEEPALAFFKEFHQVVPVSNDHDSAFPGDFLPQEWAPLLDKPA
jgi:hypothetical protein